MTDMIDSISILFGVVTFFYIVRLNDLNELLKYDYNYVMGNKKEKESIINASKPTSFISHYKMYKWGYIDMFFIW